MNEASFNKELTSIAPDLRLLLDQERRRWGVYQVRSRHIVTLQATGNVKPWLLFLIEDDQGQFRLPDRRDLGRAASLASSAHKLWDKGADWYVDKIESQEEGRIQAGRDKHDDDFRQAAKEVKWHTGVISHGRRS